MRALIQLLLTVTGLMVLMAIFESAERSDGRAP